MHRYSWDDLKFVLAVADTGTISAAARLLGVNHATVLRRIANLRKNTVRLCLSAKAMDTHC